MLHSQITTHGIQPKCHMSWDNICRECLRVTWQLRCVDVYNKIVASSHTTSHGVLHHSMATLSVISENRYDGTLEVNRRCTGWNIFCKGPVANAKSVTTDYIMAHYWSVVLP